MLIPWGTGGLWALPANSEVDRTAFAVTSEHVEEPLLSSNGPQKVSPVMPGNEYAESQHMHFAFLSLSHLEHSIQEPSEVACEDAATRGPFLLHALDLGPGHCLISLDFWLLFFVCAVGALSILFGIPVSSHATHLPCITSHVSS